MFYLVLHNRKIKTTRAVAGIIS